MDKTRVVFVDWAPIRHKSEINSGGHIRRYYAWRSLNNMISEVVPFRKEDGGINWKAVIKMLRKHSKIWVEYGSGGIAHFFVLLAAFVRPGNKLILNVHDFIVKEQIDTYGKPPFIKRMRVQIAEYLLLKRANVLIFPTPGLLEWFTKKKDQQLLVMFPGVGEDELFVPPSKRDVTNKKIKTALYFGGMRRKGIIPQIIELFSELADWELLLVGQKEGAEIEERENVKYLGVIGHDKLNQILDRVDVILISLPNTDYFDKATPNKLVNALKTCKPLIATRLKGISLYVSYVGLEKNVIYIDEWNMQNLQDALRKALNLNIDAERTIKELRKMAWEPRFRKVIEIAMNVDHRNRSEIEWI